MDLTLAIRTSFYGRRQTQTSIRAFARYVLLGDTDKLDSSFDWHKSAWPMMSPNSTRHQHRGQRMGATAIGLELVTPALAMRNMEGSVLVSEKVGMGCWPRVNRIFLNVYFIAWVSARRRRVAPRCRKTPKYRSVQALVVWQSEHSSDCRIANRCELTKHPESPLGTDNAIFGRIKKGSLIPPQKCRWEGGGHRNQFCESNPLG